MKRKYFGILLCLVLLCSLAVPSTRSYGADIKDITIDDEEYNLYTDNFPDPISDDVFAKFR